MEGRPPGAERPSRFPTRAPAGQGGEENAIGASAGGFRRRLLWFVALYAGGLAAFAALVYTLRAVIPR